MNEMLENGNTKIVRKNRFAKGFIWGIVGGVSVTLLVMVVFLNAFYSTGFVHIGTNGEIYVQDTATTDEEGIGSEVEAKLNVLDSLLDSFYMEDADTEVSKEYIYKAYLASYGDKYTVYYNQEEYQSLLESTTGKFYGIGAVCQKSEDGAVLVTEAYKNAPAYEAGIRDGDKITSVDGRDITELDLTSAVSLIKGDKGTSVRLEVVRDGEVFFTDVVRDEIQAQTVEYEMQENQIGYLSISQFENVTTQQFKEALQDLEKQGMQGLVIDIRDNPGGVLDTVVDMLDYILPNGLIVYTENKDGQRTEYKGTDNHELDVPVAVLVNENSASASEIFAGAMQDYGKGIIIGTQTFGKGIVQTIKPLTDGTAVKFTIAKYYTPKGQDIHGHGVTPDMAVQEDEQSEKDNQLMTAVQYLIEEMKK